MLSSRSQPIKVAPHFLPTSYLGGGLFLFVDDKSLNYVL